MESHSGYISFGKLGQFHPTTVMACFSLFCIAAWSSVFLIVFGDTLHEWDVIIQLTWGQDWLLFPPWHPPLTNWLLNIFFQLGGRHSTAIIGPFFYGLTLFMVYLFARRFVAPHQALLSAALLVSLYYTDFYIIKYNEDTAQPIFWILVMYLFHACLQGRGLHYWCFLGVAAAACFLTKYSAAFFLICVPGWLLLDPQARKLLSTRGPWISLLVFLLLTSSHLTHIFLYDISIIRKLRKGASNEWFILLEVVRNHSLMFFILGLTGFLWKGAFSWNRHLSRDDLFLLVFALLPFLLPLLTGSIIGQQFLVRWFWPCFLLSGLLVMRFLGGRATLKRCQWGFYACIVLLVFTLGSFLEKAFYRDFFPPVLRGQTLLSPLAEKMDAIFAEHTKHIPPQRRIVIAQNVRKQSLAKAAFMMAKPQPKSFLAARPVLNPTIDQKTLCDATIIIKGRYFITNSLYRENANKEKKYRRFDTQYNLRIEKIISNCVAQGVKPITFDFLVHYKKKLWSEKPYHPPLEVKLILLKK